LCGCWRLVRRFLFPLSYLQHRVSTGSSYARCDQLLAFVLFIECRKFNSLTLSNISSFFRRSAQLIFSILLQSYI
jgi:hypothetical protein